MFTEDVMATQTIRCPKGRLVCEVRCWQGVDVVLRKIRRRTSAIMPHRSEPLNNLSKVQTGAFPHRVRLRCQDILFGLKVVWPKQSTSDDPSTHRQPKQKRPHCFQQIRPPTFHLFKNKIWKPKKHHSQPPYHHSVPLSIRCPL